MWRQLALLFLFLALAASSSRAADLGCPNDCSGRGYCGTADGKCLCMDGWTGEDCSKATCPNSCSGHGTCNSTIGTCKCNLGYYGAACDVLGCKDNCNGHGYCRGQMCVCFTGYDGLWCDANIGCPGNCNGNGQCIDGTCFCKDGFTGKSCTERVCQSNCNNRGKCNANTGQCVCDASFAGKACEKLKCKNECSERGVCDTTTGQCTCLEGFYGPDCNPSNCPGTDNFGTACNGKGACSINATTGKSYCGCAPGWIGEGCTREKCPGECSVDSGNGVCTPTGCKCKDGYGGADCGHKGCPADCSPPHGYCDKATWTCQCNQGWMGPKCETKRCPANCNGRGVCQEGKCKCHAWATGKKCHVPTCKKDEHGNLCFGHGTCLIDGKPLLTMTRLQRIQYFKDHPQANLKCRCNDGWGGLSCSTKKCINDCSAKGICSAGVCFCNKGFYGEDCSVDAQRVRDRAIVPADVAALLECQETCRNGKCLLHSHSEASKPVATDATVLTVSGEKVSYQCLCETGWGGPNCDVRLSKCPRGCMDEHGECVHGCQGTCPLFGNLECAGHGKCVDGICKCKDGWLGDACEIAPCPLGCSNHGFCNAVTKQCLCVSGWDGEGCQHKAFSTD